MSTADGTREQTLAGGEIRPRVFVSYSRKDSAFAEQLVSDLTAEGIEAFLDTKAIAPGEPWQERLGALIIKADCIAFVLSPDSVDPKSVCDWELNEAERLQKRIIPVVCRHVPDSEVPGRLRRLNYVFLTQERVRATELARLVDGLKIDIRWIRLHAELCEDAERWTNPVTSGDHVLLQGKAIGDAELWISSRPAAAPEPTEAQRAFIRASREADIARIAKEARQIRRTQWFQRALGFLLVIGLAVVIWQDIETTKREQAVFTSKAAQAMEEERYDRAMRYALQAYPPKGAMPWAPLSKRLEGRLAGAAGSSHLHAASHAHSKDVTAIAFNHSGNNIVAVSNGGEVSVWEAATGSKILAWKGHERAISSTSFSPGDQFIVTTSFDKTARLWNSKTGSLVAVLEHKGNVRHATFNSTGSRLLTIADDQRVRIWTINDRIDQIPQKASATLEHRNLPTGAWFSPDGENVLTASMGEDIARVWNGVSGKEVAILKGHAAEIKSASFSIDGARIATGSSDGTVRIWQQDGQTWNQIAELAGHRGSVWAVLFRNEDSRLFTAGKDGYCRLWKQSDEMSHGSEKWIEVSTIKASDQDLTAASMSMDGDRIVTASDDGVARLWSREVSLLEFESWASKGSMKGRSGIVHTAVFSPDGRQVASAAYGDNRLRIWNTETFGSTAVLDPRGYATSSASFDEEGGTIVTASFNGSANIWQKDFSTGEWKNVATLTHKGSLNDASFSPNGDWVVTASENSTAHAWRRDALTGERPASWTESIVLEGHKARLRTASFSPDGQLILTASDDYTARLWRVETKNGIVPSKAEGLVVLRHGDAVLSASFRNDGKQILTVCADGSVRLWQQADDRRETEYSWRQTSEFKPTAKGLRAAKLSPEGTRVLASFNDGTVRVWRVRDWSEVAVIHASEDIYVYDATFSADGRRIVSASFDGLAKIWDAETGEQIQVLRGHAKELNSAEFSRNGAIVVSSSRDGTARVWNVAWTATYGSDLRDSICAQKLVGAQEFSDEELRDPVLSSIDRFNPLARNPCLRRGPLHWEYYTQSAVRWSRWLVSLMLAPT